MATTRTRADLVIKILEKLGIVPEGQAPEVEDTARVDRNLPALQAQFAAEEIIYLPNLEAIPEQWFMALSQVCAYELRNEFGVTGEFEVTLKNGYDDGVRKIKVMTRGRPTYEPQRATYF